MPISLRKSCLLLTLWKLKVKSYFCNFWRESFSLSALGISMMIHQRWRSRIETPKIQYAVYTTVKDVYVHTTNPHTCTTTRTCTMRTCTTTRSTTVKLKHSIRGQVGRWTLRNDSPSCSLWLFYRRCRCVDVTVFWCVDVLMCFDLTMSFDGVFDVFWCKIYPTHPGPGWDGRDGKFDPQLLKSQFWGSNLPPTPQSKREWVDFDDVFWWMMCFDDVFWWCVFDVLMCLSNQII